MRKLVNLRQLSLRDCFNLSHMPSGLDTMTSLDMLPKFVSGDETSKHGKISKLRDLKPLVNLRDELSIKFKDNFSCDLKDYEEVELLTLAPLKHLSIQFSTNKGVAIHETLLCCLQPHNRLSTISINGYKGVKLPKGTESLTDSLPHLVRIHLECFDCLQILPSLSQLHHLKYLKFLGISIVEFVENDGVVIPLDDDQLIFFPSLEELELFRLSKLKGWWREETNTAKEEAYPSSLVVPSFPYLRKLVLEYCPNLTAFPSCPKLISVELSKCHEALTLVGSKTMISCNSTTSFVLYLEALTIDSSVCALDCLFGESLGGIQHLTIQHIEWEDLSNLAAVVRLKIQKLSIRYCNNLKSLTGFVEHLTGLQSLTISWCRNLELEKNGEGVAVTPWNSLHSLSFLRFCLLPKLFNLPKAFQDLTSLEHLEIYYCRNLEALPEWLNYLTSLQRLSLRGCSKLKSLPDAIAYMPSLKTLDLSGKEDLMTSFNEPDGKDWPKICRIPRVSLDVELHESSLIM